MQSMMSLMSRTSRRNALVGFLAGSFLIVVILVLRDLNTKLDVMTQSNQRYQDMTDKQIEKIKSLQKSLKDEQEKHETEALRLKTDETEVRRSLQRKISDAKKQIESLTHEQGQLQQAYDTLNQEALQGSHKLNQLATENNKLSMENGHLHEQLVSLQRERDSYRSQYMALFKEHQQSDDSINSLKAERDRLQLQLSDTQSIKSQPLPNQQSLQKKPVQKASTSKTVLKANIEEPFVPNNRISSSTESGLAQVGVGPARAASPPAPVVAEPPHVIHGANVRHEVVDKEDVMEAPKPIQTFNQYLHHPNVIPHPQQPQLHHQFAQPLDRPNAHHLQTGSGGRYYVQPGPHQFQRRESGGENLDHAVDGAQQRNPDLFQAAGYGNKDDDDDFADGQIVNSAIRLNRYSVDHENNEEDDNVIRYDDNFPVDVNPANFGIHHVNPERNRLKKVYQPLNLVAQQSNDFRHYNL